MLVRLQTVGLSQKPGGNTLSFLIGDLWEAGARDFAEHLPEHYESQLPKQFAFYIFRNLAQVSQSLASALATSVEDSQRHAITLPALTHVLSSISNWRQTNSPLGEYVDSKICAIVPGNKEMLAIEMSADWLREKKKYAWRIHTLTPLEERTLERRVVYLLSSTL
jgi:hypothetical protein